MAEKFETAGKQATFPGKGWKKILYSTNENVVVDGNINSLHGNVNLSVVSCVYRYAIHHSTKRVTTNFNFYPYKIVCALIARQRLKNL